MTYKGSIKMSILERLKVIALSVVTIFAMMSAMYIMQQFIIATARVIGY